jgi:hypothetical protein
MVDTHDAHRQSSAQAADFTRRSSFVPIEYGILNGAPHGGRCVKVNRGKSHGQYVDNCARKSCQGCCSMIARSR